MARPTEIAADARALYGPPSVRPAAGDMGDGALWVDPGNNQALSQVQSGNWVRIALPPLRDDLATGTTQTTAPGTGAADALPATPAGYVAVTIDGAPALLPFYRPAP